MAEDFLTVSGQPQQPPQGASGGGVDAVSGIRGITVDNTDPANPIIGLPGPITNPSPGVPLVYLGTSDEYVPAQQPFAFPVVQATVLAPNESATGNSSEIAIRSGGGYVGLVAADGDAVVFAGLSGNAVIGSNGDGTSALIQATNDAASTSTLIEATLTGESNDSPSLGFFGAPPVVQPTIGGDTTGDLAALQQVVRNMLTALQDLGLWIDGTVGP